MKEKLPAGLLGIFLGSLGVHKFYLGYTKEGLIMLIVSVVGLILTFGIATGIMEIIGFIEGIIYLTKSDEDFQNTYVVNHKGWF
jgi:TM2 domain-containing membrane protein YozV